MRWPFRLALAAAGLFLIIVALTQILSGKIVFESATYHQQTFTAGGIGVGTVLFLLAFLPPSDWVYRHITTKKQAGRHLKKAE